MLDENQQFQNEDQQMQGNNQQFSNADAQLLNEGELPLEAAEGNESGLTEVGMVEDGADEGIAAANTEGVPPPNEFSGAPPLPGTLKI